MTSETREISNALDESGALLKGHFLLSSGLHSDRYLQCALALQHPRYAELFGRLIAERFTGDEINCVAGPALGGIIIAHEVARSLGTRCIFTERREGEMALRRGFAAGPDDNILAVEDVVTTGRSIKELIEAVRGSGARVAGVGAIVDRSKRNIDFGCRTESLVKMDIPVYPRDNCPLCKKGIPLVKPGSRA